jgi:hypothetical protein
VPRDSSAGYRDATVRERRRREVSNTKGFKAEMMRKTMLDLTRRHGMGWATGSEIMSEIIDETKSAIRDKKKRKAYYKHLIHVFQMHDCDTLDDCRDDDSLFSEALDEMQ